MDFGKYKEKIDKLSRYIIEEDEDKLYTYLYQNMLVHEDIFATYLTSLRKNLAGKKGLTYREIRTQHAIDQWYYQDLERKRYNLEIKAPTVTMQSLTCNKCGSHDFSSENKMTRRADEGMTVIYTCNKCRNVIVFTG